MARTNSTEVGLIIETSLTSGQIDAFINDANVWVTNHLSGVCDDLTDAELKIIEKYLAAHLITLRDARLTSLKEGDISEKYQRDGKMSEYLKSAIAMDPCGIVADQFVHQDRAKLVFRVGSGFDDDLDLPASS